MRKLIVLIGIIALFGCEKERCWECTATATFMGQTGSSTLIYCGDYTAAEVKQIASQSMAASGSGYSYTVTCKEQ